MTESTTTAQRRARSPETTELSRTDSLNGVARQRLRDSRRSSPWVWPCCAGVLTYFVTTSVIAQELAPLENVVDFLVNFLTGAFARSVAIIAVAVMGYLGLTGRLRWGVAGAVIVGIALIFGAATIVDAISGSV
ncbi:MAG: VIRB2 type IV secretion [Gammaproteobacteria bacterium]|nr:MAG: VIRB2 type IV secretion [Gammaproteobacteria bacterium]